MNWFHRVALDFYIVGRRLQGWEVEKIFWEISKGSFTLEQVEAAKKILGVFE